LNKKSIALILPLVLAMLVFTGGIPFAHATGSFIASFPGHSVGTVTTFTVTGVAMQMGDTVLVAFATSSGCAADNPGVVTDTAGNSYVDQGSTGCNGGQTDLVIIQSTTSASTGTFDVTIVTGGNSVNINADVTVWRGYQGIGDQQTTCAPGFPSGSVFVSGDEDFYTMIEVPSSNAITPTGAGWTDISNNAVNPAIDDGFITTNGMPSGTHSITFTSADLAHNRCFSVGIQNRMTFTLTNDGPFTIAPGASFMSMITAHFFSGSDEIVHFDDPSFSFSGEVCRVGVSDHPSPGTTCAFSPHTCDPTGTTCTTQMTVTSVSTAEAGTFTVSVKGETFGTASATTTLTFTVTGNNFYSHLLASPASGFMNVWDETNVLASPGTYSSVQGEYSPNWVGKTLSSITIDMGWDTNNGCTPTGTYTIGVFDGSQVTVPPPSYVIQTGNIATLNEAGYNVAGTASRISVSGLSHVMAANEMIGFTASDTGAGCGGIPANIGVTAFCDVLCNSQSEPNGVFVDFYADGIGTPISYGSNGYGIDALFQSGSAPPPPPPAPPTPSEKASVFVLAFMVIAMASIVVVAYEKPENTVVAIKYVGPIAVGLAIVFVVLHAVGF
jgi:hypothetical protein